MSVKERTFKDKIFDLWLGKCIGGNMGYYLECYKKRFDFTTPEEFTPTENFANDDLDLQLVWLDLLQEKGLHFSQNDLMKKFYDCYPYYMSEYGYSKRNYIRGIDPPLCGRYNNYFSFGMGAAIRGEIWGIIFAGDPDTAAAYARNDAEIDHCGFAVDAEEFVARVISLAFESNDLPYLLEEAAKPIASDSKICDVVHTVLHCYKSNESLHDVVDKIYLQYGHSDGTYAPINIAIYLAAMLYSKDNFNALITNVVNAGYDTDCTAATAGALFGLLYGSEKIEEKWKNTVLQFPLNIGAIHLTNDFGSIQKVTDTTSAVCTQAKKQCRQTPCLEFTCEYLTEPEIGADFAPKAKLVIKNNGTKDKTIDVKLELPEGIVCSQSNFRATVGALAQTNIELAFRLADDCACVSDMNIIKIHGYDGDKHVSTNTLGFAGIPVYAVSKPYFDINNRDILCRMNTSFRDDMFLPLKGIKEPQRYDLSEISRNFVRWDHPYIDEKFDEKTFNAMCNRFTPFYAAKDRVDIGQMFGYQGACCVYALSKVYFDSDEELELHIGHTDPFVLWFNGQQVCTVNEHSVYTPYNVTQKVTVRQGINNIAIKLLRYGEDHKFSLVYRKSPFGHVGEIKVGMKYQIIGRGKNDDEK